MITVKGLSPLKKRLLKVDLAHTQIILLDELQNSVEKIKGNRNLVWKIVRLLSKATAVTDLTVDSFIAGLETLKSMDVKLFDYTIKEDGDNTILTVEVDDVYFDLYKSMPMVGRFLNVMLKGRKDFIKKIEKSIREDYSKDYKIRTEIVS